MDGQAIDRSMHHIWACVLSALYFGLVKLTISPQRASAIVNNTYTRGANISTDKPEPAEAGDGALHTHPREQGVDSKTSHCRDRGFSKMGLECHLVYLSSTAPTHGYQPQTRKSRNRPNLATGHSAHTPWSRASTVKRPIVAIATFQKMMLDFCLVSYGVKQ